MDDGSELTAPEDPAEGRLKRRVLAEARLAIMDDPHNPHLARLRIAVLELGLHQARARRPRPRRRTTTTTATVQRDNGDSR